MKSCTTVDQVRGCDTDPQDPHPTHTAWASQPFRGCPPHGFRGDDDFGRNGTLSKTYRQPRWPQLNPGRGEEERVAVTTLMPTFMSRGPGLLLEAFELAIVSARAAGRMAAYNTVVSLGKRSLETATAPRWGGPVD